MVDRIWLKHYPPGVPHDINVHEYESLVDLLEESFQKFRDRDAYIYMGKHFKYGEAEEMSRALAAFFQSKGLKRGARIAIMMPNVLQNPIAIAAVLRAGYTVVNVNPLYTQHELEHQLKDSGAEAIVVLENFAGTLQKALPRTAIKHVVLASIGELLGFKGKIVNFVVRRVKKMVPGYSIPGATWFADAVAAGRKLPINKPRLSSGTTMAFICCASSATRRSGKGQRVMGRNRPAFTPSCRNWLTA
jgi:long-chain acyl-CoA synthetase